MDTEDIFNEDYLADLIAMGEPAMPPEEHAQVEASAQQLSESIKNFKDGEAVYGSLPETYEQAKPKQEATVEAIKEMNTAYADKEVSAEAKQEKKDKATDLMQEQSDFFKKEYEKMQERDRLMQAEIQAMRKQLEVMQQMMQSYSPDAIAKCVQDGMQFINNAELVRLAAMQKKQPEYGDIYKATRAAVSDVYRNIKEMPQKMKESIKEKAYDQADKAINCIAGWFDKGIKFIEARKQAVLALSPKHKEAIVKPIKQPEVKKEAAIAR